MIAAPGCKHVNGYIIAAAQALLRWTISIGSSVHHTVITHTMLFISTATGADMLLVS